MRPLRVLLLLALPALAACPLEGGAGQRSDEARSGGVKPPAQSAAGAPGAAASSQSRLLSELAGTHWRLQSGLHGHDPASIEVTLAFEGTGRIGGNGGCNGYGADITADDGGVRLGPVVATKRGCPGARNQVEMAWFEALAQVETLQRDAGALLLLGQGVRLRLVPADPAG